MGHRASVNSNVHNTISPRQLLFTTCSLRCNHYLFLPDRLGSPVSVAAFLASFLGFASADLSLFPGRPRFFFSPPSSLLVALFLFVFCFLFDRSPSASLSPSRLSPALASSASFDSSSLSLSSTGFSSSSFSSSAASASPLPSLDSGSSLLADFSSSPSFLSSPPLAFLSTCHGSQSLELFALYWYATMPDFHVTAFTVARFTPGQDLHRVHVHA